MAARVTLATRRQVWKLKHEVGLSRGEIGLSLNLSPTQVKRALLAASKPPSCSVPSETSTPSSSTAVSFTKLFEREDFIQGLTGDIFDKGDLYTSRDYVQDRLVESAVLHLTDLHIGKVNRAFDFAQKRSVETYNFEIFQEELKKLRRAMQEIHTLLSTTYNLEKLYIVITGDIVENDRIYQGQRFHIDAASGAQLWRAVGLVGQLIRSLKPLFPKIEVVGVVGNHGRTGASGKEDEPITSNFDYHIYKILELVFQDDSQVTVTVPDSPYYVQTIYQWNYLLLHGDNIKSWSSLPFYGLARAGLQYCASLVPDVLLDLIISGHFHQTLELPLSERLDWITSASWVPKDAYSFKVYKTFPRPTQRLWGVNPKRARTWSFKIDVQTGQYH